MLTTIKFVILSEAKDLFFSTNAEQQVLRCAQHDKCGFMCIPMCTVVNFSTQ